MLAGHQKASFIQHGQDHEVTTEPRLKHTHTHTYFFQFQLVIVAKEDDVTSCFGLADVLNPSLVLWRGLQGASPVADSVIIFLQTLHFAYSVSCLGNEFT